MSVRKNVSAQKRILSKCWSARVQTIFFLRTSLFLSDEFQLFKFLSFDKFHRNRSHSFFSIMSFLCFKVIWHNRGTIMTMVVVVVFNCTASLQTWMSLESSLRPSFFQKRSSGFFGRLFRYHSLFRGGAVAQQQRHRHRIASEQVWDLMMIYF